MPKVQTQFPNEVQVIENVFVPLPDGTLLAAKVWRPVGEQPVPVVLEYVPYRKRDGTRTHDQSLHMYLAGHGYAGVRLDIRGSGDSEGLLDDEYTMQEQRDGVAAIAWLATQDWCDGSVSMIGISWGGFNGLQISAHQPPALKTVISVGSTDDRYATDIHWVGGCLSKDNFDWSSTMFAHNDLPPDPEIVGEKWREMWQARIKHNKPWALEWFKHQRRDAYWKQGSVCEDFSKIKVPVYAVSGWADNYAESVPRLLAGLSGRRLGLIGPWAHSYPHDVAVEPAIGWLQEVLRWLDHWHKDIETGIMDGPMYRVWMQDYVPPQTCYLERAGRWVAEESWPTPRIRSRKLHLGANGSLNDAPGPAGTASICSPLWVGLAAGEVGRYGNDADWPPDQREDDGGSLVFTTPALVETTEILGAPQLRLRIAADKSQALVAVRLNDVAPDGRSTRVTLGLLNLTHRDSHENATTLVPGKFYDVVVDLDDIAHSFAKGHRIAVALSSTYWPIAWPSPELATLSIALADSWIEIPVRPERADDANLRPFDEPIMAENSPYISHDAVAKSPRSVRRELLSGLMVVDFPRWTYVTEFPDLGQTNTSAGLARYEITEGDPLSARTFTEYHVKIARKDTTIAHHSTGILTCDATHFRLQSEQTISENDVRVFHRIWDERIARDMV